MRSHEQSAAEPLKRIEYIPTEIHVMVPAPGYPEVEWGSVDRTAFEEHLRSGNFAQTITASDVDADRGAGWPWFLAACVGIFLAGKPINENVDAWIELAKKFAGLLSTLRERFGRYRIDQAGALLVATQHLVLTRGPPKSVEVLACYRIDVAPLRDEPTLDSRPDSAFVLLLDVDGSETHLFVVESNGSVRVEYMVDREHWMFFGRAGVARDDQAE